MTSPTHQEKIQQHSSNYILQNEDAYFSGAHVRAFFGPIWVDDIITIQWDLVNNKAPIYGYASRFFDAVADGTVIVNGSFTIAFKDMNYLTTILEKLRQLDSDTRRGMGRVHQASSINLAITELEGDTTNLSMKAPTIDMILAKMADQGRDHLDYIAERLENVVYGKKPGAGRIPRADEYDKVGKVTEYGKIGAGFDILLEYGNPNTYSNEHTAYMINDVHITGQGQLTAPTGEPIAERYTFFAKSMNEGLPSRFIKRPDAPPELETNDLVEEAVGITMVREDAIAPAPTVEESDPLLDDIESLVSLTSTSDIVYAFTTPISAENNIIINVACKAGWQFKGAIVAKLVNAPKDKLSEIETPPDAYALKRTTWRIAIDPTTTAAAYLVVKGTTVRIDQPAAGRTTNTFTLPVLYGPKQRPKSRVRTNSYPSSSGGRFGTEELPF